MNGDQFDRFAPSSDAERCFMQRVESLGYQTNALGGHAILRGKPKRQFLRLARVPYLQLPAHGDFAGRASLLD
jgi:hypothetical protein